MKPIIHLLLAAKAAIEYYQLQAPGGDPELGEMVVKEIHEYIAREEEKDAKKN